MRSNAADIGHHSRHGPRRPIKISRLRKFPGDRRAAAWESRLDVEGVTSPPRGAHGVRALLQDRPLWTSRAQGRPGACRSHGPPAEKECRRQSPQVRRGHPGPPCAMGLRIIRALPGDRACLPPSPAMRVKHISELGLSVGRPGPRDFIVRHVTSRLALTRLGATPAIASHTQRS